jgi:predicted solute-binding protein
VYNDTGLTAGSYAYRAAAYNKPGMSAYSNVVSIQVTTSIRSPQADRQAPAALARSVYTLRELSTLCTQPNIALYDARGTRLGAAQTACPGVLFIRDAATSSVRKIIVVK